MKTAKQILRYTIVAALSVFLLGCSFNFTTAKIEDAIMTNSIDENGIPGEEVVSFPADSAILYTSAKVRNAPDNTKIRIVWTYVTGNQKMDEITLDSGTISDRYIYSSFEPTALLPNGDYQVEYYIEDRTEPDATVKFVVVAAGEKTAANTDGAYVEDAHMTSYIDENGYPADTITTVAPTGTWYVSAVLRNTQANTMIRFIWYDATGATIASYDFDPQGKTDIYISGTLELTSTAPDGQYRVEIYVDDAATPAKTVTFAVGNAAAASDAANIDYTQYSQKEGGFSIAYPSDWNVSEMKASNAASFYPTEYMVEGYGDANTVVVVALPGSAKGYTLDSALQSWITSTEDDGLKNYQLVQSGLDTANGNDIAIYAYSWTDAGYDLNTIDFLMLQGDNLYLVTFTGTKEDFNTLYPYVQQMVLSFQIL
ncbi:MAG: PsbP-related protein [Christensenella sp.]|nr:PsbP-related protein [Christensenella sp.]